MPVCSTKKICYLNREAAEDALLAHRARFNHPPTAGPINVYLCNSCGCYHFTSKGEMNPKLLSGENKKKIDRDSEANYWLDKLK